MKRILIFFIHTAFSYIQNENLFCWRRADKQEDAKRTDNALVRLCFTLWSHGAESMAIVFNIFRVTSLRATVLIAFAEIGIVNMVIFIFLFLFFFFLRGDIYISLFIYSYVYIYIDTLTWVVVEDNGLFTDGELCEETSESGLKTDHIVTENN